MKQYEEIAWPPEYTVRRSKKARRVSLRVSREDGLEVVIPERAPLPDVRKVLEDNRRWVLRKLWQRDNFLDQRESLHAADPFAEDPAGFRLHGGKLRVALDLQPNRPAGGASLPGIFAATPPEGEVAWPLSCKTATQGQERLMICLKAYSRQYLSERLNELSRQHSLGYRKLGFGMQKSRWGSYSSNGTLTLNHKLVFLPHEISDHVILHELCHSIHPDHSARFWNLMQEKDPDSLKKNADLSEAGIWVPSWFN